MYSVKNHSKQKEKLKQVQGEKEEKKKKTTFVCLLYFFLSSSRLPCPSHPFLFHILK